jgi:hypothetical protein
MGERPQRSILDEIFIKYHFPCQVAAYFNRNAEHAQETVAAHSMRERGQNHQEPSHSIQKKSPERPQTGSPGDFFRKMNKKEKV